MASHVNLSKQIKNLSINAFASILIANAIEQFIIPELPFFFSSLSARMVCISD